MAQRILALLFLNSCLFSLFLFLYGLLIGALVVNIARPRGSLRISFSNPSIVHSLSVRFCKRRPLVS